MFESMIAISLYLMAVLTPVLIPAAVHAFHATFGQRPNRQPARNALVSRHATHLRPAMA